jgi:hypothetical protein
LAFFEILAACAWLFLGGGCAREDISLGEHTPSSPIATAPVLEAPATPAQALDAGGLAAATSGSAPGVPTVPLRDAGASLPDDEVDSGTPRTVARPSAGCARVPSGVVTSTSVRDARVDFLLDLPPGGDSSHAYPLVLAFRGLEQSAADFRAELQLASVMGAEAIIAYANPVDGASWEFSRDMPLVDALVATLGAAYCLDLDRVFALGHDEGALFVNLVGCVRADTVRAIAVLSSAPPPPGPCLDNTAVWLLQDNTDDFMTVGAGLGNRDFWASRNACNLLMPLSASSDACVAYAGCRDGLPVHYCEHDGSALPGFAAGAAWEFFRTL